jgi:hypothetical protein
VRVCVRGRPHACVCVWCASTCTSSIFFHRVAGVTWKTRQIFTIHLVGKENSEAQDVVLFGEWNKSGQLAEVTLPRRAFVLVRSLHDCFQPRTIPGLKDRVELKSIKTLRRAAEINTTPEAYKESMHIRARALKTQTVPGISCSDRGDRLVPAHGRGILFRMKLCPRPSPSGPWARKQVAIGTWEGERMDRYRQDGVAQHFVGQELAQVAGPANGKGARFYSPVPPPSSQ